MIQELPSAPVIHPRTLVFDFDGTVALGHGPVRAYAAQIALELPANANAEATPFLGEVDRRLDDTTAFARHLDGYDLVRHLAEERGASAEALSRAYLRSRDLLASEDAPISAPAGLSEFLEGVRTHSNVILATNAPAVRLAEALDSLGLADAFDRIYTNVGKPTGFDAVLDEWLPHGPLLSIGDVWANDHEPVRLRGGATALIRASRPHPGAPQPTYLAATLPELYPVIAGWLDSRKDPS